MSCSKKSLKKCKLDIVPFLIWKIPNIFSKEENGTNNDSYNVIPGTFFYIYFFALVGLCFPVFFFLTMLSLNVFNICRPRFLVTLCLFLVVARCLAFLRSYFLMVNI